MTLCDAGPLVAMIDLADANHARCVDELERLPPGGLLTTWACFAETMHLVGRKLGWRGQDQVWSYIEDGLLQLHEHGDEEWQRMRDLMRDYADTPMDLADASVVAASEALGQQRVFTIDRHFHVYRQNQSEAFEVVP